MPERSWLSGVSLEGSGDPGEGVAHEGKNSERQHMNISPPDTEQLLHMHRCSHQTGTPIEHPPAASVLWEAQANGGAIFRGKQQ